MATKPTKRVLDMLTRRLHDGKTEAEIRAESTALSEAYDWTRSQFAPQPSGSAMDRSKRASAVG